MSDTPRTDELAKREFVPDGLWIKLARELERENAALREDKARLDWLDYNSISRLDRVMVHCEHNRHISIRAAIDAARKEAQP